MKRHLPKFLLFSCCLTTSIACAQTDDAPASNVAVSDAAVWDDLDINDDDSLDGIELKRGAGGWIRYDIDGNGEISKAEFLVGRFRDGTAVSSPLGASPNAPKTAPTTGKPAPAKRKPVAVTANAAVPAAPAVPRAASRAAPIAPIAPRAGYIVGRAVFPDGSPVPSFTVDYSGFEKGKSIRTYGDGTLIETINDKANFSGGRYAIKVPPGTYRATAYASYNYRGRTYHFDMELLGTPKYDFPSRNLEELRGGLVRDFVLKMAAKKKGASEESETLYTYAYFGGTVNLDAGEYEGIMGGGNRMSTPLNNAFPPESMILLTLTPNGPRVDGTAGQPVNAQLRLGDDGKWTFMVRGVYPGLYEASAKLRLPDGQIKPLRLSTKDAQTDVANSRIIFKRESTATVDFLPKSVGVAPRKGVDAVTLYLGD